MVQTAAGLLESGIIVASANPSTIDARIHVSISLSASALAMNGSALKRSYGFSTERASAVSASTSSCVARRQRKRRE